MPKDLDDSRIDALARAWIAARRRGEEAADDQVHESVVILTFAYSAETQWKFVTAAVALAAESIDELYAIAAGPFEGLMGKYGDDYIDRVEAEAARDPKFREMLHGSWQHLMSDQVWARVEAARGKPTLP
ncbi:MAG TPA: hypothetical protein VF079_05475 [Sphingomicrobium sp.]